MYLDGRCTDYISDSRFLCIYSKIPNPPTAERKEVGELIMEEGGMIRIWRDLSQVCTWWKWETKERVSID